MSLDYPSAYDKLEYDERVEVISAMNSNAELRTEIDDIVGLDHDWYSGQASHFTSDDMAALVIALGGPRGIDG